MAREIVPVVKRAPVSGGINGTDPSRDWPHYLTELRNHGVSGVLNWPSVGLIDGIFRENLEGSGLSLQREVEVVNLPHNMGLLTAPWGYKPATTRACPHLSQASAQTSCNPARKLRAVFFVAGGYTLELFDELEESFDQIALG